jgi:hypothetical protein
MERERLRESLRYLERLALRHRRRRQHLQRIEMVGPMGEQAKL